MATTTDSSLGRRHCLVRSGARERIVIWPLPAQRPAVSSHEATFRAAGPCRLHGAGADRRGGGSGFQDGPGGGGGDGVRRLGLET